MRLSSSPLTTSKLAHLFTFGSKHDLIEEDYAPESDKKTYNLSIEGWRRKYPDKFIQMTITTTQLESLPNSGVPDFLKRKGFVCISAHINPNTGRKIHTLMVPPLTPTKKRGFTTAKSRFSSSFVISGVAETGSARTTVHGGGCCGVRGLLADFTGCETLASVDKVFRDVDEALQLCLPSLGIQFLFQKELFPSLGVMEAAAEGLSDRRFKPVYDMGNEGKLFLRATDRRNPHKSLKDIYIGEDY